MKSSGLSLNICLDVFDHDFTSFSVTGMIDGLQGTHPQRASEFLSFNQILCQQIVKSRSSPKQSLLVFNLHPLNSLFISTDWWFGT